MQVIIQKLNKFLIFDKNGAFQKRSFLVKKIYILEFFAKSKLFSKILLLSFKPDKYIWNVVWKFQVYQFRNFGKIFLTNFENSFKVMGFSVTISNFQWIFPNIFKYIYFLYTHMQKKSIFFKSTSEYNSLNDLKIRSYWQRFFKFVLFHKFYKK